MNHYLIRLILSIAVIFSSFALKSQWTTLPFPSGLTKRAINFINKDTGFVSCGIFQGPPNINIHTQLYKTKDGGNSWQMMYDDYTNTPISQLIFFNDTFGLYRRWQDIMMKTYSSGVTGYSILSGGQSGAGSEFQAFDSTKYLFPSKDEIRYTLNGGASWISRSLSAYVVNPLGGNVAQFANLKNGFIFLINTYTLSPAYVEVKFCKTTDSCQTLQPIYSKTISGTYYPDPIDFKFLNDSTAIMSNKDLVMRVNGFTNTTFDTLYKFTSPEVVHAISIKDNIVIIGGNYGTLLSSVDSGLTFQTSTVAPTPLEFSIADSKLGVVYALTSGNTVIKLNGLTTSLIKNETSTFKIFPNPTSNELHIQLPNTSIEKIHIDIFDYTGRLINTQDICSNEYINVSQLLKGYYLLKLSHNKQIEYMKFIKE